MSHTAHLGPRRPTVILDREETDNPPQTADSRQALDVLAALGRVLAMQSGQQQMLGQVLAKLEGQLGLHRGTIMLLSPDGSELVVEAATGVVARLPEELRYQSGEGIVGSVVASGQPAIIDDISREPRFQNRIHRRPESETSQVSFLCVPISVGSEVVGTLSFDLPPAPRAVLEERARFLGIVASMIAFDVGARRIEAARRRQLEAENLRLRSELGERFRPENVIGNSRPMRDVYVKIRQVATTDTTVLLRGEPGTGKEFIAGGIHYGSPRAGGPLVKAKCAALSQQAVESELFGHEVGVFTGAAEPRSGRIEEAAGGTLFLDEIGDLAPGTQIKLLRVLQEGEFERLGSSQTRRADIRVVAATSRNIEAAVEQGVFRQDLYYRISVFPICLPPLREHRDDILLLADHFVEKYARRMGKSARRISTPAINMMLAYHWPGNVRELENCIEYAVLMSVDGVIHGHSLPPTLQMPEAGEASPQGGLKNRVELLEKDIVVDALKYTRGNVSAAARQLGISPRMLRYKIKKLGIDWRELGGR